MATYTSNYGLHQWAPEDNFLRTDFNEDLEKIDTALQTLETDKASVESMQAVQELTQQRCRIITGSYQGDDTRDRFIDIGTQPKVVAISYIYSTYLAFTDYVNNSIVVQDNGFFVSHTTLSASLNESPKMYHYLVMLYE